MNKERHYAAEVLGDIDAGKMPNAATAYRAMDQAERLRALNAELLAALEETARCMKSLQERDEMPDDTCPADLYDMARTLISKAKGQA